MLQSVKNWFNPTGHGANKAWLARQKDGGGGAARAARRARGRATSRSRLGTFIVGKRPVSRTVTKQT